MRVEAGVAYPEGPMTLAVASALRLDGERALAEGAVAFDLAGVTQVDSSALSLLLSWRRSAQPGATPPAFRNLPDSMLSLTRLYGLAELI